VEPTTATATAARMRLPRHVVGLCVALALLAGGLFAGSLLVGTTQVSLAESWQALSDHRQWQGDSQAAVVIRSLRLPRGLACLMIGAALGLGGSLLQSVTRNPLAETGLLGVNAGAALAVVVAISVFGVESALGYLVAASIGALGGCLLVAVIASSSSRATPLRLVLAGVAVSSTCIGLTAFLVLRSGAGLDQYRYWLLGAMSGVTVEILHYAAPAVLAAVVITVVLIRPLAALGLGDDTARALGHRPLAIRLWTMLAVTLLAGAAVAVAGPIGFLGLVAPHAARRWAGASVGLHCLLAALFGSAILMVADIAARLVVRPYETPVSVLLAFVGAPLLIWLARSGRFTVGPAT